MIEIAIALAAGLVTSVVFWYRASLRAKRLELWCSRLEVLVFEAQKIISKGQRTTFEDIIKIKALTEVLGRCAATVNLDYGMILKEVDSATDRIRGEETIKRAFNGDAPDQKD